MDADILPFVLRDALTVAVGVATGVLSGMFGVGGAVLSTPGIRVLGASPVIAIGSTIPSILPSAAVGTVSYTKEKLVDWDVALWAGVVGLLFSVGGALLTPVIPGGGHLQQVATAALLTFSAWRLLRAGDSPALGDVPEARPAGGLPAREAGAPKAWPRPLVISLTGAGAGLVSGILGIGGGTVMVPAFTEILGLNLKRAVATSLVCVGMLAVPGGITHWALGNIDWRFALWLTIGVIPGARIGSHITIGSHERTVRRLFGGFLLLLGLCYGVAELVAAFTD